MELELFFAFVTLSLTILCAFLLFQISKERANARKEKGLGVYIRGIPDGEYVVKEIIECMLILTNKEYFHFLVLYSPQDYEVVQWATIIKSNGIIRIIPPLSIEE